MRTDAINRFASSELCRSLQDGGKTPLTFKRIHRRMITHRFPASWYVRLEPAIPGYEAALLSTVLIVAALVQPVSTPLRSWAASNGGWDCRSSRLCEHSPLHGGRTSELRQARHASGRRFYRFVEGRPDWVQCCRHSTPNKL